MREHRKSCAYPFGKDIISIETLLFEKDALIRFYHYSNKFQSFGNYFKKIKDTIKLFLTPSFIL